jgi:hypothetical protein
LDFAISCTQTKDNASTCQSQTVGYDKDGKAQTAYVQGVTGKDGFKMTQVGDDGNGGLVDKTTGTGAYTASVGGTGVSFSQDGGKTSSGGVFVNGTDPTHIQGSGDLSGFAFTFTNSKLEASQTAAGTFTFDGTQYQAGQALMRAGFNSMGMFGMHGGHDEYRSSGTGIFGENSGHINVQQIKMSPSSSIPHSSGDMHFGEHNPMSLGLFQHIGEAIKATQ